MNVECPSDTFPLEYDPKRGVFMRNGGTGFRFVGWGVLVVLVVGAAAAVIGYQFKLIGDQRTFIDVNSGDTDARRTVMGITFSDTITSTQFSEMARQMGLAGADRDWRQMLQFSWLSGTETNFPLHGADVACGGAIWKLRNEKTNDDKKKLLDQYVALLRQGNVKGMEDLRAKVGAAQEKRLRGGGGGGDAIQ
jgi:hypothetical protein